MARLSLIDQEPKIGRALSDLAAERQYLDFFPLDDAADLDRAPLFFPDRPEPGTGPFGAQMVGPAFRRYRHEPLVAYEFADLHLLGTDGAVLLDGAVVRNTVDPLGVRPADSNIREIRDNDRLVLRQPMPVSGVVEQGRYAIGFTGGWRDYRSWLTESLPKLYAFALLRRRFKDLKVALPPLPPGSAQRRTLDLLGIPPEAVLGVPANAATCFARAIVLPTFDAWAATNFLSSAADAMIARLPPADPAAPPRPDKIYIPRAEPGCAVTNAEAIRPLLDRYGFVVVSFEGLDLTAQMAAMQAARHVICEHAAGSANILFCREAARVLELFNPFTVQPSDWSIASRRGLDYGYLIGTHSPTPTQPQADQQSAYAVPPDRLEDGIRATLRLPPRPAAAAPRAVAPPVLPPPAPIPPAPAAMVQPPPRAPMPPPAAVAVPLPPSARVPPVVAPRPVGSPFAAPAGMAAPAPTSGISGIVEPPFEVTNNPARFGRAGRHERLTLFAPAMPAPQLPLYGEPQMPADFLAEHYFYPAPPAVAAYAVGGGVVWSNGLVTLGSQFVALPDCLPGYFHESLRPGAPPMHPIHAGAIGRDDVKTITLERPVAVATHPNLGYGHVLLEVLPRLWLLAVLREYGADIPLALSRTLPDWVKAMAGLLHAEQNIVWYDGANERLRAPSIVLPAMLHTEYNFHPALNLMVRDLVLRVPPPDAASPKLIYLAQANFGDERLENAAEIEQAMRGLGFTVVRLAELSPPQQIRLFAGARAVVAEHGEALNGALFAPPGTRIVALNFANHYQSAIARLRGHRIAYVPPADGQFRHWRLTRGLPRMFRIDPAAVQRITEEMLQGAV